MTRRELKAITGIIGICVVVGTIIYLMVDNEKTLAKQKQKKKSPCCQDDDNILVEDATVEEVLPETKVIALHDPVKVIPDQEGIQNEPIIPLTAQDEFNDVDDFELAEDIGGMEVVYREVVSETQKDKKDEKKRQVIETIAYEDSANDLTQTQNDAPSQNAVKSKESNNQEALQTEALPMEEATKEDKVSPIEIVIEESEEASDAIFPLKLGKKGHEVERLQIWLLRKYGKQAKITKEFDNNTEHLVHRSFGTQQVDKAIYDKHQMGLPLNKQKGAWK